MTSVTVSSEKGLQKKERGGGLQGQHFIKSAVVSSVRSSLVRKA